MSIFKPKNLFLNIVLIACFFTVTLAGLTHTHVGSDSEAHSECHDCLVKNQTQSITVPQNLVINPPVLTTTLSLQTNPEHISFALRTAYQSQAPPAFS